MTCLKYETSTIHVDESTIFWMMKHMYHNRTRNDFSELSLGTDEAQQERTDESWTTKSSD
jgi:hypothetical protein